MRKKEVIISKKTAYISMNTSLILFSVFLFLLLGNTTFSQKYSFVQTISNYARNSETKTFNVTVSAENKEQYQELLTFNGTNINSKEVYSNSVLAIPNHKNSLELVFDEKKIMPTAFTLRTLFSYKQNNNDDFFKLESDDLFVTRTEETAPASTKTISITKSIAEKIANFMGESNFLLALGQILNLNYFNYESERVNMPVFVKSIIADDVGIMPAYKLNYGGDLIFLAANAYDYNIVDSRLDIRYSQSIYRNLLHTEALTEEFGGERLSFVNNNFLSTTRTENLDVEYRNTFLQTDALKNPLFITFLVLSLFSSLLTILCIALYFKSYMSKGRKHNFISILPFLIFIIIFYAVTTVVVFATKDNVTANSYLMAPRSIVLLVSLVIGAIITGLSSKNKGIKIDEKNKS